MSSSPLDQLEECGDGRLGRLFRVVAESPYDRFLTIETEMRRSGFDDDALFLQRAHDDGLKLLAVIRDHASGPSAPKR